jgi:hypothetical protein
MRPGHAGPDPQRARRGIALAVLRDLDNSKENLASSAPLHGKRQCADLRSVRMMVDAATASSERGA